MGDPFEWRSLYVVQQSLLILQRCILHLHRLDLTLPIHKVPVFGSSMFYSDDVGPILPFSYIASVEAANSPKQAFKRSPGNLTFILRTPAQPKIDAHNKLSCQVERKATNRHLLHITSFLYCVLSIAVLFLTMRNGFNIRENLPI